MLATIPQELMTVDEAARWFRRSPAWVRGQAGLVRLGSPKGQALFHVRVCRAYVYGRLCNLDSLALRAVQLRALGSECGLNPGESGVPAITPGQAA